MGVRSGAPHLAMDVAPFLTGDTVAYPMVAAFSGRRQEVAVFSDRDALGNVLQSFRVLDLVTGEETRPYVGGNAVVAPAAATYRAEDDAYYILDKITSTKVSLVRLDRDLQPVRLFTWTRGSVYTDYGLATGAEGSLVITTSSGPSSDPKHCVATLRPDPTAPVEHPGNAALVAYKQFLTNGTRMELPAQLGIDGAVTMVTRSSAGSREFLSRPLSSGTNVTISGIGSCF